MFSRDTYSLIDFGNGRRLERFGELILDRPCPSAVGIRKQSPNRWSDADARFVEFDTNRRSSNGAMGVRGEWLSLSDLGRQYFSIEEKVDESKGQEIGKISGRPWPLPYMGRFVLELKGSPFGHIGVFPEQAENWDRIFELCQEGSKALGRPLRILNLFGYTGGSALAAAAGGAETTHLDAARNVVAQARRNAELSFSSNDGSENVGKLRWICDDAVKFVKREGKRGSRYDGVILDPPTYGHGARGEVWRLSRDLKPLLENIVSILTNEFSFVMLSGHTPGFEAPVLEKLLRECAKGLRTADRKGSFKYLTKVLQLKSEAGGALYSGDLTLGVLRN